MIMTLTKACILVLVTRLLITIINAHSFKIIHIWLLLVLEVNACTLNNFKNAQLGLS